MRAKHAYVGLQPTSPFSISGHIALAAMMRFAAFALLVVLASAQAPGSAPAPSPTSAAAPGPSPAPSYPYNTASGKNWTNAQVIVDINNVAQVGEQL